ncbi:hypothetical protein MHB54_22845 [Paenibacillus sp. FSL M7-0802]|uniref:hypothetical protein n=1 Tax=Paenibacillus TaxID=44249 RepID=UPI002221B53F|nr:hypothetical protein [Paenibacillus polymyxa]
MLSEKLATVAGQSYMAEMFNDGLFYLHKGNEAEDIFVRNRFHRSAIVNFCTSGEAAMSTIVHKFLMKNESSLEEDVDIELLKALNGSSNTPENFVTIPAKIYTIERLMDKKFERNTKNKYRDLTKIRNKIIHFSSSYKSEIYSNKTVERMANVAPEIVDVFITELFKLYGHNSMDGFQSKRTPSY